MRAVLRFKTMPSDRSQPYRRQASPSSLSELEQLAAKGREAHLGRQRSMAAKDEKEQLQRAMDAVSPRWAVLLVPTSDNLAVLAVPLLFAGALLSAVCMSALSALVSLVAAPLSIGTNMLLWLILTILLTVALLMLGLRHGARVRARSLQRELDWVEGLPFRLQNHMLWLANTRAQAHLALDFRSAPDRSLVNDAIRAVVSDARVEWSDNRRAQVQIKNLDTGPNVRQFHLLTERVLLSVHRQYGILEAQWLESSSLPLSFPAGAVGEDGLIDLRKLL